VEYNLAMTPKPPAIMAACGWGWWGGEIGMPRGRGGFKKASDLRIGVRGVLLRGSRRRGGR